MNLPLVRLGETAGPCWARLVDALMELMTEKDYADITVTDLTKRAGVSRMAYYRSFSSKEEVLDQFMDVVGRKIHETVSAFPNGGDVDAYFQLLFHALGKYSVLIQSAYKARLGEMILAHITRFMRLSLPDCLGEYPLYYLAGGFYNLLIQWILTGKRERVETLAALAAAPVPCIATIKGEQDHV